jgi:hypothetical protein
MTDGKFPNTYEPLPHAAPRRRWWEKQRFIIPIAVAFLAPAVFFVTGLVAGEGAGSQQAELSAGQAARNAAEPAPGAAVPDDSAGDAGDSRDEPAADDGSDTDAAGSDAVGSDAAGSDVAVVASADIAQADAAEPPAVCERILALREQFEMHGVNPLDVYLAMLEIQDEAGGTAVAGKVDDAVRTMEDFVSGNADTADVVAAGGALVAAC